MEEFFSNVFNVGILLGFTLGIAATLIVLAIVNLSEDEKQNKPTNPHCC